MALAESVQIYIHTEKTTPGKILVSVFDI